MKQQTIVALLLLLCTLHATARKDSTACWKATVKEQFKHWNQAFQAPGKGQALKLSYTITTVPRSTEVPPAKVPVQLLRTGTYTQLQQAGVTLFADDDVSVFVHEDLQQVYIQANPTGHNLQLQFLEQLQDSLLNDWQLLSCASPTPEGLCTSIQPNTPGILKLSYIADPETHVLSRIVVHYSAEHPLARAEIQINGMETVAHSRPPRSALHNVFSRKGALLPAYQQFEVSDLRTR